MSWIFRFALSFVLLCGVISSGRCGEANTSTENSYTVELTVTPKAKSASPFTSKSGEMSGQKAVLRLKSSLGIWDVSFAPWGDHHVEVTVMDDTVYATPIKSFSGSFSWQSGKPFRLFEDLDSVLEAKITEIPPAK